MAKLIIDISDDLIPALEWAASREASSRISEETPEPPALTVGEYVSWVMGNAAASYAKQAEAEEIVTLGRAALAERKAMVSARR